MSQLLSSVCFSPLGCDKVRDPAISAVIARKMARIHRLSVPISKDNVWLKHALNKVGAQNLILCAISTLNYLGNLHNPSSIEICTKLHSVRGGDRRGAHLHAPCRRARRARRARRRRRAARLRLRGGDRVALVSERGGGPHV